MSLDIDWYAVLSAALLTYLVWPTVTEFGRGFRDGWNEVERDGDPPPSA